MDRAHRLRGGALGGEIDVGPTVVYCNRGKARGAVFDQKLRELIAAGSVRAGTWSGATA